MRKIDECGMDKFDALDSEKTIAILGYTWWPRKAKQVGDKMNKHFYVTYEKNVMSAQMIEASPLGVGTVLRLERDAWSMVK